MNTLRRLEGKEEYESTLKNTDEEWELREDRKKMKDARMKIKGR